MTVTEPSPPERQVRASHIARFERFFLAAAGLEVDPADLARYEEFVDEKIYDLLDRGCEVAKDNGRKAILPVDLPITSGLSDCIEEFRELDQEIDLIAVLERLAEKPQLELEYDESTYVVLPEVIGGISIAIARAFKILDPETTRITTPHWEHALALLDLVL